MKLKIFRAAIFSCELQSVLGNHGPRDQYGLVEEELSIVHTYTFTSMVKYPSQSYIGRILLKLLF